MDSRPRPELDVEIIGDADAEAGGDGEAGIDETPDAGRRRLRWWIAVIVAVTAGVAAGPVAAAHIQPSLRSPSSSSYPPPGPPDMDPQRPPTPAGPPEHANQREDPVPVPTPTGENANQREGRGLDPAGCPTS